MLPRSSTCDSGSGSMFSVWSWSSIPLLSLKMELIGLKKANNDNDKIIIVVVRQEKERDKKKKKKKKKAQPPALE